MSAELFWDLVEPALADGRLDRGTIMGNDCVRCGKEFVAMPEHRSGSLVVKLTAARVAQLVDAGRGLSFAPAGRTFKEWVEVPVEHHEEWEALIEEARLLAGRR
jgi:hypothetical protein